MKNQGKNLIFQGQEKVREFFEKPKGIENEDSGIGGLQKKQANVSLHNRSKTKIVALVVYKKSKQM